MSIIEKVFQNVISRTIQRVKSAITRDLIFLSATSGAHYLLGKPVVLEDDYIIKFQIYMDEISNNAFVLGDTETVNNGFWVNGVGRLIIRDSTGNTLTSEQVITSNKIYSVEYVKSGGNMTGYVGGVEVQAPTAFGTIEFNMIAARRHGEYFFPGIISLIDLINTTTPANSQYYKLNSLTKQYELPTNNVFGSENVINGDFSSGTSNWTSGSGSTLTVSSGVMTIESPSPDTFGNASQPFVGVLGVAYEVSISLGSESGTSSIPMGIASTDAGVRDVLSLDTTVANIVKTGHFVGTGATVYIVVGVVGSGATVECINASIIEVNNYITYENIALDARDTYTPVGNVWLGSDLVTQDIWENPQNTPPEIWTFADDKWSMEGDGSYGNLQLLYSSNIPPVTRVEGVLDALSGDPSGLTTYSASSVNAVLLSAGPYSVDGSTAEDGNQQFKRKTGTMNATLSKPSIRRLLEIA
ncbi:MAG: hypothetical protein ACJAV1_002723 [Paraglaciecola sp.]|jgi:hypothetical protein